jgi:hypothetical protein
MAYFRTVEHPGVFVDLKIKHRIEALMHKLLSLNDQNFPVAKTKPS